MKKIIFLLSIFTIVSCDGQISSKQLNENLIKVSKSINFPGFGVAIIKNDSVVFSHGFGFANRKQKTDYNTKTIQPVGSVSKTFIGFSLMKAIDLGYFDLDDDINTILPFKVINPNVTNDVIRIRDLVTHTSGIVDDEKIYITTYNIGKKPNQEIGNFLKNYLSVDGNLYNKTNFSDFKAGKNYQYSNIASTLAAYLIELKAKMLFADFTKKYIFEPLQMNDSHWFYDDSKAEQYATLYEINKQSIPFYNQLLNDDGSIKTYSCITYPDGSLKTSVADLTKYLLAMMKGFEGKSNLLSQKSFQVLFQKQFTAANLPTQMDPKEPNRAVFWAYNKKEKIMHTGGDPGIAAFISFDPKTKIGRIILINANLDGDDNVVAVTNFKKIISEIEKFETNL